MEKIKLKNGTILEFSSISEYNNTINVKLPNNEFDYIKMLFSNPNNLSSVEILTDSGGVCAVYEGYNKVDRYVITDAGVEVHIKKPNEIEQRLDNLEDAMQIVILDVLGV